MVAPRLVGLLGRESLDDVECLVHESMGEIEKGT
jgi:hypothetical protein